MSTGRPLAGCKSGLVRGIRSLVYAVVVGGVGYRLLAGGQLTLDTSVGRTLRPWGRSPSLWPHPATRCST
jgi:hypothetical protein